ncbi:MAG: hypothetical protein KC493_06860 [Bacteriovoracaceae bacterium]|nr:hypothetical protein [Bacteriovoracaceae bacterium]
MKKLIITFLFVSFIQPTFSQETGRFDSVINEYMRRKERVEKKAQEKPKEETRSEDSPKSNSGYGLDKTGAAGSTAGAVGSVVPKSPGFGVSSPSKSYFKLGVEPFKITRVDKNRNYGLDAKFRLQGVGRYIFDGKFNFELEDQNDPYTDDTITRRHYQGDFAIEKTNFLWNLNLLVQAGYQRERSGPVFPIYRRMYGGVIGLKFLYENERDFVREFSASFLPIYDRLESDAYVGNSNVLVRKKREYIRQYFQIDFTLALLNYLKASNHFHWRPVYDLDTKKFNANNAEIEQRFTLTMELTKTFSLSWENKLTWDKRMQVDLNRPTTDLINSFKMNWKVGL